MEKKVLISGNEAIAEAAIQAGCYFYAGYPITPQNELIGYMAEHLPQAGGIFIQAESELAAINMVFGASAAGARAMTSSSSPGISLKQEGISYIAGSELPAVIVNVMRGGPGLGNIAPSQSDYFQATKSGGHGDYHLIVLAPYCVQEAFDLTTEAFALADKYRTPVMLLLDAFLGQMAEPIRISAQKAKTARAKDNNWTLTGAKGRPPRIIRSFFLREGILEAHNLKLQKKYAQIADKEHRWQSIKAKETEVVFVAYGTAFRIAKEAALILKKHKIKAGLFRPISLWPFPYAELKRIASGKKAVFVFELSAGQMLEDVRLALGDSCLLHFYGRLGGGVFSIDELVRFVRQKLKR